jgi:hypothetical protein
MFHSKLIIVNVHKVVTSHTKAMLLCVFSTGDWMQPGSTRVPRSEGIYCLGCHNAQFGPNCSGCGRKLLDKVFSIKGTIFMYCSEVCRYVGGRKTSVHVCMYVHTCVLHV